VAWKCLAACLFGDESQQRCYATTRLPRDGASITPAVSFGMMLICCSAAQVQGQRLSACKLHSATVWELDITLDKKSATFDYVLRADWEAGWQAR
jgi:hypothetical protein